MMPPEVPVMVMVVEPTVAVAGAVIVRTLVSVVVLGLKDAVTPAGRPLAVRVTGPSKLLMSLTMMVLVAVAPCTTVMLFREAERE